MAKFGVNFEKTYIKTVIVEADSYDEARRIAFGYYSDGEIDVDEPECLSNWRSFPAERWNGKPIPEEDNLEFYGRVLTRK